MSSGKSKKGKTKGKTLNLDEFLNDYQAPDGFKVIQTNAWSDDNNENVRYSNDARKSSGKIILPTAPKSARAPDVDLSKVPSQPPFKAFLGNLPYDVNEEEVIRFFKRLKVKGVTFPGLRPRGIACAEFDDRPSLIEALAQNGDNLKGRTIRVYVSHENEFDRQRHDDREDRTPGDWRSARSGTPPSRPNNFDNDRRRQGSGFQNYDKNPYNQNRYGGSRDFSRNDRFNDDKFEELGRNRESGSSSNFENRPSFRRDFGNSGGSGDRRPYSNANDSPPSFRRNQDSGLSSNNSDRGSSASITPAERPKLNLQPRSKPVDAVDRENSTASSSIFGGAKPVDTASKDLKIEEKLLEVTRLQEKTESGTSSPRNRGTSESSFVGDSSERSLSPSDSAKTGEI